MSFLEGGRAAMLFNKADDREIPCCLLELVVHVRVRLDLDEQHAHSGPCLIIRYYDEFE